MSQMAIIRNICFSNIWYIVYIYSFIKNSYITVLFFDVNRIFDTSLVIHVNLSVLVWGCSIISMVSSFIISNSKFSKYFKYLNYCAFTGTLLMVLSVFFHSAEPIKNNYIPIINNQYFLSGLSIFIISILCYSILSTKSHNSNILQGISLGIHGTSIILTCAILCFSMSYYTIHTKKYIPVLFYEYIFWGGGHILQLAFSQTLLLVYLIILEQKVSSKRTHSQYYFYN